MDNQALSSGISSLSIVSHSIEDEKIQVLRIPHNFGSDNEDQPESDENPDQANSNGESAIRTSWQIGEEIPEENEEEYNESNDLSDTVSVFTLYLSQEETLAGSTEANVHSKNNTENPAKIAYSGRKRFRFTRIKSRTGRSQSAPPRPLTMLEEFKESLEFSYLESIALIIKLLPHRTGGKFDFESYNGHYLCSKMFSNLEKLSSLLNIKPTNRNYRKQFSQPYKVLFPKLDDYSYLIEILDSAQGKLPYILVNGEKYIFSTNALLYGEQLFNSFMKLKNYIRDVYEKCTRRNFDLKEIFSIIIGLQMEISDFDRKWAKFERIYILELMIIENDAKRLAVKAIKIEKKMKAYEVSEKLKGNLIIRSDYYNLLRKKFIEVCGKINSVANFVGKGRDDLNSEIIIEAEDILRKISDYRSCAVRKLAGKIKATFETMRDIFRKYSENMDGLDPELCNNKDLVDGLVEFEKAWERGKNYFLDPTVRKMLLDFSQLIECLCEKHKEVKEKFESMDADIFLIVPSLAILRSLDDSSKTMYNLYYPEIQSNPKDAEQFAQLKHLYEKMKKTEGEYFTYNKLEEAILEQGSTINEEINKIEHEIKRLAILLQRNKPSDWNLLMETAMGIL